MVFACGTVSSEKSQICSCGLEVVTHRSRRIARDVCSRVGFWSLDWAQRTINWHDHVSRRTNVLKDVLDYKDASWLQEQRSQFVAATGSSISRVSLLAGRTGTRLNIGKPQCRWHAGIDLAQATVSSRAHSLSSTHTLSIGTRIREAAKYVASFFNAQDAPT